MSKQDEQEAYRLMHRAYIRNGQSFYTGESLLLACMLHAKGKGRKSDDMRDLRKIMKDQNLDN